MCFPSLVLEKSEFKDESQFFRFYADEETEGTSSKSKQLQRNDFKLIENILAKSLVVSWNTRTRTRMRTHFNILSRVYTLHGRTGNELQILSDRENTENNEENALKQARGKGWGTVVACEWMHTIPRFQHFIYRYMSFITLLCLYIHDACSDMLCLHTYNRTGLYFIAN